MLARSAPSRLDRRQLRRPLMRFCIQSNRRARLKTAHCGCLRPSALVRSRPLGSARARRRATGSVGIRGSIFGSRPITSLTRCAYPTTASAGSCATGPRARAAQGSAAKTPDLSAGSCPGASLPRHCPNGKGSTAATRNLQTVVDIRLNANRDRQAAGAGLPVTVRLTAGFDVTWLNQRAMLAT